VNYKRNLHHWCIKKDLANFGKKKIYMKKAIILILIGFSTLATFSQTGNKIIGINKQFYPSDTTRTFSLLNKVNLDSSIDSLIKYWGTPEKNSVGNIRWMHIDIPNIGTDLNILLTDGICTKMNRDLTYEYFNDNEDKARKLNEIKPNQSREVEIIVTDKDCKNVVNNKTKTDILKKLLEKIVS
jgi:hypothetical protein